MRTPKAYFPCTFLVAFILVMFSCGTDSNNVSSSPPTTSKTLNINFHDNILNTNPIESASPSERLLRQLVFNRLLAAERSASIIKNYVLDSTNSTHIFSINMQKRFHDGTPVNSYAVKTFFKYLIEKQLARENVRNLFSSMSGFNIIDWYRQNHNVMDSLPRGFQILNDSTFHIRLTRQDAQLKEWLQAPEFSLFKIKNGEYIGTGEYKLANLNEDISAKLTKVEGADANIEAINISFIKNPQVVFSEFIAGSLDLITYNKIESPSLDNNPLLNKLLKAKYPEYQVEASSQSIIHYAELNNISDSTLQHRILKTVDTRNSRYYSNAEYSNKNTTPIESENLVAEDSIVYQIPVFKNLSLNINNYFKSLNGINYIQTNAANLNPTGPYIVIKEMADDGTRIRREKTSIYELSKPLGIIESKPCIILETFPTYVIYNNKLSGIEKGQNLSEMINSMYFHNPKTY